MSKSIRQGLKLHKISPPEPNLTCTGQKHSLSVISTGPPLLFASVLIGSNSSQGKFENTGINCPWSLKNGFVEKNGAKLQIYDEIGFRHSCRTYLNELKVHLFRT